MQIFKKNTTVKNIYLLKSLPKRIEFNDGLKTKAVMSDNTVKCLGCLKCHNKKCINFDKTEYEVNVIKDFPADMNGNVCPVSAITVNLNDGINIDATKCISCGLCAKRCPVGAIYFINGNPMVNEDASNYFLAVNTNENQLKQQEQIKSIEHINKTGTMILENDLIFSEIYEKLQALNSKNHDLVGRNILIGLKCYSGKRRIGDVYTRMDAIYHSFDNSIGAVEIEFGRDTLDAARAILDDIAVLNVRYNLKKEENNSLIICLQLPNVRQGYWQVIKDIKNVENIIIQTISVGALYLLLWNNKDIRLKDYSYYIDFDDMSLRTKLQNELKRNLNVSEKFLGILEPQK